MPKGWCRPSAKTEICLRLAVGADAAKDLDLAGLAFGQEQIAVGREAQQARIVEAGGIELDLEALGRDGPGVGGARRRPWGRCRRIARALGCGQVGDGEMAAGAGGLVERVGECGLAGQDGVIRLSRRRRPRRKAEEESGERGAQAAREDS